MIFEGIKHDSMSADRPLHWVQGAIASPLRSVTTSIICSFANVEPSERTVSPKSQTFRLNLSHLPGSHVHFNLWQKVLPLHSLGSKQEVKTRRCAPVWCWVLPAVTSRAPCASDSLSCLSVQAWRKCKTPGALCWSGTSLFRSTGRLVSV